MLSKHLAKTLKLLIKNCAVSKLDFDMDKFNLPRNNGETYEANGIDIYKTKT